MKDIGRETSVNRAIIIVLDSLGVGALPDAEKYGDKGVDTLGHIAKNCRLNIPNLLKLGMGNICEAAGGRLRTEAPAGCFGRFAEASAGKDTITGHWEIAGLRTDVPFKTYHDGFPEELMDSFAKAAGRGWIGNCVASGTEIIEKLGDVHEKTGKVIVYTSADSVFQIAANTEVVPLNELYSICEKARELLKGEYSCGRVIARPYVKDPDGKRRRTSDRRDYAVSPPEATLLDILSDEGLTVCSVGKISDIFNGRGVSLSVHTDNNNDGIDKTLNEMKKDFKGLIFTNLVDFDSLYGHRRDPEGYAAAIEAFDKRLPEILDAMRDDDMLILCSDHGNDPLHAGFDHTREYIFGLITGKHIKSGVDLGTRSTFADIGATVCDILTDGRRTTQTGESLKRICCTE